MPHALLLLLAATNMSDSHAAPRIGELKTFGDWTVGCDNVRTCTLASLGPEAGDFPRVTVAVTRTAGPAAPVRVDLHPQQDAPRAAAVTIDGRRFDPGRDAIALVQAMIGAQAMAIRGVSGGVLTQQSLKGAAAALRYMDAVQGRAGTVTALVAKGPKPPAAVPAAPPMPVIAALRPGGPATLPPAATLARLARQAQCEDMPGRDLGTPEAHALGGGATLVLIPCSAGAYNLSSAMFVVRGGRAAPAQVDAPVGFAATGAENQPIPNIVTGGFADGVLTSYARGRGLGDCGVTQDSVWDGTRFRLSRQAAMGECRGNPDYVPLWRATVVRR